MRMLDNCSLEADQVKELQDDVAYYIEENQEPEFLENEFIYDDLDLDDTISKKHKQLPTTRHYCVTV